VPLAGSAATTRRVFAEQLAEGRARTLLLVSPLSDDQVHRIPQPQVDSVLSQLERILRFEQSMLLDEPAQSRITSYDEWFDRMMDVRERVVEKLNQSEDAWGIRASHDRYRLVLEHEYRCNEAILESVQCQGQPYPAPHQRPLPSGRSFADPGFMVRFSGGAVEIGDANPLTWPEEQPAHTRTLEPFWIDALPVTNADYMTFIVAGGYDRRELWSDAGWAFRQSSGIDMPGNWSNVNGTWRTRWMGRDSRLQPDVPVSHVSCFEAEAFAAFVGKRLPTEFEWETAASWDPETQRRRSYPWGNMQPSPLVANLDQFGLGPSAVGAFPGNISPVGCYGMIGDVWEWTASAFLPYAAAGPAPELPVGRFGADLRVLRGGSWATRTGAIRVSVRRAASPEARHLFSGFRCARNA
jgi:gamma-glutamyl hercynylcysteine S-oxide synthase